MSLKPSPGIIALAAVLGCLTVIRTSLVMAQEHIDPSLEMEYEMLETPYRPILKEEAETRSVIDQLNDFFEHKWSFRILYHKLTEYEAVVKGELSAQGITKQQFGTAEIQESPLDMDRPITIGEALKQATTEAFKKAAGLFGIFYDRPLVASAPPKPDPTHDVPGEMDDLPVFGAPDTRLTEAIPPPPPSRTMPAIVPALPDSWFDPATTLRVGTPMTNGPIDPQNIKYSDYMLNAVRIDDPPKLDGLLDDAIWKSAPAASGFRQFAPDEGAPDTEHTEVRVLYDAENLYFGVMCYDREPDRVIATEMRRDVNVDDDDAFDMTIAPYGDQGDSYYFITNPLGSRRDALFGQGGGFGGFNQDWDGIWQCYGKRHEMGWSLEIAIPFKTFRFDPNGKQDWAVNFGRHIKRTRASAFWVPVSRKEGFLGFYTYQKGGRIVGLEGISPGRSLEILPYSVMGALGQRRFTSTSERIRHDFKREFGGDIKWGITPGITADITLNPDFAQISADRQVVNLSRFEFRFDERRPFFLEGAGIFQFGSFFTGPQVFFSRRIGTQLFDGSTVPILHGEKISGKFGKTTNFGILNVHTRETPWALTSSRFVTLTDTTVAPDGSTQVTERDSLAINRLPLLEPETNWNVFRLRQNLFGRSTIGVIGTMKEPEDRSNGKLDLPGVRLSRQNYNRVVGMDLALQPNNSQHILELIVARSWLPTNELHRRIIASDDSTALNLPALEWAGTVQHSWRNALFNTRFGYNEVRPGFFADMGFVPRRGIRTASGSVGVNHLMRKWGIRSIGSGGFGGLINGRWITGYEGGFFNPDQVQTWNLNAAPGIEFENGVLLGFNWDRDFDRLNGSTSIAGVHFPAGEYTFDRYSGSLSTDRGRPLALRLRYQQGDFYSGRLRNASSTVTWKPTFRSLIELDMTYNRLQRSSDPAAGGNVNSYFDERIIPRLRLNYSFSTDMFLSTFFQLNMNRESPDAPWRARTLTGNILFGYTMQQGHTLFLSYNTFADDALRFDRRRDLRPANQTFVAKFSYLFNI